MVGGYIFFGDDGRIGFDRNRGGGERGFVT